MTWAASENSSKSLFQTPITWAPNDIFGHFQCSVRSSRCWLCDGHNIFWILTLFVACGRSTKRVPINRFSQILSINFHFQMNDILGLKWTFKKIPIELIVWSALTLKKGPRSIATQEVELWLFKEGICLKSFFWILLRLLLGVPHKSVIFAF